MIGALWVDIPMTCNQVVLIVSSTSKINVSPMVGVVRLCTLDKYKRIRHVLTVYHIPVFHQVQLIKGWVYYVTGSVSDIRDIRGIGVKIVFAMKFSLGH